MNAAGGSQRRSAYAAPEAGQQPAPIVWWCKVKKTQQPRVLAKKRAGVMQCNICHYWTYTCYYIRQHIKDEHGISTECMCKGLHKSIAQEREHIVTEVEAKVEDHRAA